MRIEKPQAFYRVHRENIIKIEKIDNGYVLRVNIATQQDATTATGRKIYNKYVGNIIHMLDEILAIFDYNSEEIVYSAFAHRVHAEDKKRISHKADDPKVFDVLSEIVHAEEDRRAREDAKTALRNLEK